MTQYRPLEGVRVLSFEVAASLPAGTRTLADLGADVVRVAEPPGQVNPFIRVFDSSLINKRSIVLDLRHEAGRALAKDLALAADVVCNNFRPHVLQQFGLGHQELHAGKPDLIVLQLSGYGSPGPWASFPAYGPSVEAAGGMNSMMGEASEPPQRVGGGVFADTLAGRYAAFAICAALERRKAGGGGEYIDLSMYECIVTGVGDHVVQAARSGVAPARRGNRSESAAPQGIYPAEGVDEWVAITVATDGQWAALRRLLGDPALDNAEFDSFEGRKHAHDAIDLAISRWTRLRPKDVAAEALQKAGIAAGPVQRTRDLPVDPQYIANEFFQPLVHAIPILGYEAHPHMRLPARIAGHDRAALHDHTPEGSGGEDVLRAWLSASHDDIDRLRTAGAFGQTRPVVPDGAAPPAWFGARGAHRDHDFAERLGLTPALAEN